MDNATAALAKMNMILHDCPDGGNLEGQHAFHARTSRTTTGGLKTFDFVVANPPFSDKAWSNGFDPGQRPLSSASRTASRRTRTATTPFCCTSSPRSRAPARARSSCRTACSFGATPKPTSARNIVARGYIKGIIGLPANLFYGTGIPACIIVLDKENAAARTGIFMIDACKGFVKDGNKNRLRDQDIHKIVDVFTRQVEIAEVLAHGAAARRSSAERLTTSTSRATSTAPSPKTCKTSTRT